MLIIKNNNIELLKVLRKTIPKTINSNKVETKLLNVPLECKNDNIDRSSLDVYFSYQKHIVINEKSIAHLLKNYYYDITKFKTFIKRLISPGSIYEEIFVMSCVVNDDIDFLQILLNKYNIEDFIKFSRLYSSGKIMTYIQNHVLIHDF